MRKKKKKENKDKVSEEDLDNFLKKSEERIKERDFPEDIKKYVMEILRKEVKRAKEREPIQFKPKVIKKRKPYSDIEIQLLKIDLENLNHRIREAEEKGQVNFEVVRKLQHLKSEDYKDRMDYIVHYIELVKKLFIKDPSRIEKLKELRDLIRKKLEKIEENQK